MNQNPLMVITGAEANLWTGDGQGALDYLHATGLTDETIRRARLGWSRDLWVWRSKTETARRIEGITFPWFSNTGAIVLIRVLFVDTKKGPKWIDVYRGPRHPFAYPNPNVVMPGCVLVLASNCLEVLVLTQELPGATVICLDSSGHRVSTKLEDRIQYAKKKICAYNQDEVMRSPSGLWVRIEPPGPAPNWSGSHRNGCSRIANCFARYLGKPTEESYVGRTRFHP